MQKTTKPQSKQICNADKSFCIDQKDYNHLLKKSQMPKYHGRKGRTTIYFAAMYSRYTILFFASLLTALGIFTYGNDFWMVVRFLGFALACYVLMYFIFITAPVFVFFAKTVYVWLVGYAGIGATMLTAVVFTTSLALGFLGFLILVFSQGALKGYVIGRLSSRSK